MVPDGQKVWTDRMDGRTHGHCQNYIPPTSSGYNMDGYDDIIIDFISLTWRCTHHKQATGVKVLKSCIIMTRENQESV